ncbi:hypothetical protein ACVWW6_006029 [Bradyrhizobium sp. USDA 3311]
MTDKLTLYNLALAHLNERRLVSLNEQREPRRVLDDFWPSVAGYCLERKIWNFMLRTVQIDASSTMTPAFGYLFAFAIPDDWVRTRWISTTPEMQPPLNDYKEETGYWFANFTPLFITYTSNDPLYGMNLGVWPSSFEDYVSLRLAGQACGRITGKSELLQGPQGLIKREEKAYKIAASNCAMNDAVGFAPVSSWVRARRSYGRTGPGGDTPGSSLMS